LATRLNNRKPPSFQTSVEPNVVTIPGHPGDDVPAGTLKSIQKDDGRYAVIFEQAPNNWAAYVPDLPGCITTGATLEDTERNIREAIEGRLETFREFGEPTPAPATIARDV